MSLPLYSSYFQRNLTVVSFVLFVAGLAGAARQAASTAKKVRLGRHNKVIQVRTKTHFYRPKTKSHPRTPKYDRKSMPSRNKMDEYRIVKTPLTTESAMKKIEENNTLVFIVDLAANKRQIKAAVKKLYNIDCLKVNTLVRYGSVE